MSNQKDITEIVEDRIREVRTKSLDVSFNEILDMYNNKELLITPEYQRLFRWDPIRQSQFIESIILEMPLPPVFFVENEDGTYELIDGLQRISTYLKFRGQLINAEGNAEPPSVLNGCEVLEELNGNTFDSLSTSVRLKLKRNFIRAEILQKQTDREMRYHMFKRLNTGGMDLSDQEIRNCTARILGSQFIDFINTLAKENQDFLECMKSVADQDKDKMIFEECVLRYFALKNNYDFYKDDMKSFLDDYIEKITRDANENIFNYSEEKELFEKIFRLLNITWGKDVFTLKGYRRFSKYQFEAFTLGVTELIDKVRFEDTNQIGRIREAISQIKDMEDFKNLVSGSFLFKKQPLDERINFVKNKIEEIL